MALYVASLGGTKSALTAASTKSLILLNPSGPQIKLRKVAVSLDASAAAAGVQFDIYRTSTLGTPAGSTGTLVQADVSTQAATTASLINLSAEPTSVTVLSSFFVQPLGGFYADWFPFGAEFIGAAAGARIGLRYTTPAGVSPDCLAELWFEE